MSDPSKRVRATIDYGDLADAVADHNSAKAHELLGVPLDAEPEQSELTSDLGD